ncbi:T9SS type A sorting domain-containing protein [Spirosoma validum]|nr:T9SS type A sorting domain-containing protein [Spirosoma validum]
MEKVYKICTLLLLSAVGKVNGQTTYFEQNFSAGGTPSSYVSSTPNNNQVNGLAGLSATITNNAVQFTRPTDSGTGYISRSSNFSGTPTSLHVQFSFEAISNDPAVTATSAVMFYVGSGFSSGPTNPNNGDTYARLGIALSPAGSGQFQVRTVPSGGGGTTSASFSGRQTITFAMNNSGATLNYVSPTGSMETLPDDTYDIWIGTIKFANDQSVLTPGQTINNFKFRINDGVGVMQIGDIRIRDINGVLPVTLLSFTAKPEGDRVQLAWSTTMERNADRFVIERSADLSEYVEVGEVIAKGTTDERQNYGLTDLNPQPGVNYYRLKQIDLDGTVHEYKPISAILKADEPVVTLFPNPANPDRIHLRLWNADSAVIQLFDAMGQPVNLRLERQPGSADLLFNHPLTPGIYWINVQMNGQKQTIKVLIR